MTQAPLATGFNELWRLVWDYDVSNVVMLMDMMEKNKPEVSRYWPLHGHAQSYGDISVRVSFVLIFTQKKKYSKQECIPVGCLPSAAVAVWGVSVQGGCLPRGCTSPACGQNDRRL